MFTRPTSFFIVFTTFLFSSLVYAQPGSLSYGPASIVQPAAVPINGPWSLALLALAVGGLGYLILRRQHTGRVLGALLSVSASLAVLSGGLYIQDAGAPPLPVINLDNPAGGSVVVPENFQEYRNTSGVEIKIELLTDPCGGSASNTAEDACADSRTLAQEESCTTQYQCPELEVCDGIDNDLDESIDEGLIPPDMDCGGETPQCKGVEGWQCPLVCAPDCTGKACGTDGCGGSCGSCGGGNVCNSEGSCIIPVCGDLSCDGTEDEFNCPIDCAAPV